MTDTLKPCPHCKDQAKIASNRDWHHLNVPAHHYNNCIFDHTIATVPATDENLEWLKKQWNTRHIEDELVEALEEICQEFAQQHPLIRKGREAIAKARGTHNE